MSLRLSLFLSFSLSPSLSLSLFLSLSLSLSLSVSLLPTLSPLRAFSASMLCCIFSAWRPLSATTTTRQQQQQQQQQQQRPFAGGPFWIEGPPSHRSRTSIPRLRGFCFTGGGSFPESPRGTWGSLGCPSRPEMCVPDRTLQVQVRWKLSVASWTCSGRKEKSMPGSINKNKSISSFKVKQSKCGTKLMANVVLLRTRYFQPKRAQVRSGAPKAFLYLAPAPAFFSSH